MEKRVDQQKVDTMISNIKKGSQNVNSGKGFQKSIGNYLKKLQKKGYISKADAQSVKTFFDIDMCNAIAAKSIFEYNVQFIEKGRKFGAIIGLPTHSPEKIDKLLEDSGLKLEDLIEAAQLAGPDYTVQQTKLSESEKKASQEGKTTSSELHNINNFLNAKIKEKGGKKLSTGETLELMCYIGLNDGTSKYEEDCGEPIATDGSVTNRTEAKMQKFVAYY